MSAKFIIIEGVDKGREVAVKNKIFKIGRSGDNDLVLADDKTSRFHVEVSITEDGICFLEDKASLNGVFLNGERVKDCTIKNGDILKIGRNKLLFQKDDSVPAFGEVEYIKHKSPSPVTDEGQPFRNGPQSGSILSGLSGEDPTSITPKSDLSADHSVITLKMKLNALSQISKALCNVENDSTLVSAVMNIVMQTMNMDRGGIFLYDPKKGSYSARSFYPKPEGEDIGKDAIGAIVERFKNNQFSFISPSDEIMLKKNPLGDSNTMVSAVKTQDLIHGFVYLDSLNSNHLYSIEDIEAVEAMADMLAAGLEKSLLLKDNREMGQRLEKLSKHLSPEVAKAVSDNSREILDSPIEAEEKEVTVLFSDICDFTRLSERLSPPEVASLLNEYFSRMVEIVIANNGTVNKFIGDAVMALFGAPIKHPNDIENAVNSAIQMIEALKKFHAQIDEGKRFNIRIGINTGNAVVGVIGSEKRMEYTVLGDTVNCASRIESLASPNGVAIGELTYQHCKGKFVCEPLGNIVVKGKSRPINVYNVKGLLI